MLLQRVARLVPDETQLSAAFLYMWLTSDAFVGAIDPGRSNGVPHISTKAVAEISLWLPSLEAQARIVRHANELLAVCHRLARATERADATALALSKAIRGSLGS